MKKKIILINRINDLGGTAVKKQPGGKRDKIWVEAQAALSLQGAKATNVCAFFQGNLLNISIVKKNGSLTKRRREALLLKSSSLE